MRHLPLVPKRFSETLARAACVALVTTAALVTGSTPAPAQAVREPGTIIAEFQSAVADYVALHRRLERGVEPIVVTRDLRAIQRGIDAMAVAIRTARAGATQGDLFTPELAGIFRSRIDEALRAHGLTVEAVLAAAIDDMAGSRVMLPVNGAFPWHAASAMPACLFDALPALPRELEYRLVGPDLVLMDLHANLIVDVLRQALGRELTR